TRRDIITTLRTHGESALVRDAIDTKLEYLTSGMPLDKAWSKMQSAHKPMMLVMDEGQIKGAVEEDSIEELNLIHTARSQNNQKRRNNPLKNITDMIREFERYVERGQAFIQAFAAAIGEENLSKASEVLERVFAAMRQHLPFNESVNVMECLPMAIRGLYMDRWTLGSPTQRLTTTDSFIREIARGREDETEIAAVDVAKAAIETIAEYGAG